MTYNRPQDVSTSTETRRTVTVPCDDLAALIHLVKLGDTPTSDHEDQLIRGLELCLFAAENEPAEPPRTLVGAAAEVIDRLVGDVREALGTTLAASSATETPVQPVIGTQDDRTSEMPTETLVASVQAAVRLERIRAADLVRAAAYDLLCGDCGVRVHDEDLETLARLIEGDARG